MKNHKKICPHEHCQKAINKPFIVKGVYFCPSCLSSVLLQPINNWQQLQQERDTALFTLRGLCEFDANTLKSIRLWLLTIIAVIWIVLYLLGYLLSPFVLSLDDIVMLIIIVSCILLFIKAVFRDSLRFRLHAGQLHAGVDKLDKLGRYDSGLLLFDRPTMKLSNTQRPQILANEYQQLNGCPCCHSQLLVSIEHLHNTQKPGVEKFYQTHDIATSNLQALDIAVDNQDNTHTQEQQQQKHQEQYEKQATEQFKYKDMSLCLNCHQHYVWQKVQVFKNYGQMMLINLLSLVMTILVILFMVLLIYLLYQYADFLRLHIDVIIGGLNDVINGRQVADITESLSYISALTIGYSMILMLFCCISVTADNNKANKQINSKNADYFERHVSRTAMYKKFVTALPNSSDDDSAENSSKNKKMP